MVIILVPPPAYEYGAEEMPGKEDTTQTTTIVGLMVRRVNVLMALLDIVLNPRYTGTQGRMRMRAGFRIRELTKIKSRFSGR